MVPYPVLSFRGRSLPGLSELLWAVIPSRLRDHRDVLGWRPVPSRILPCAPRSAAGSLLADVVKRVSGRALTRGGQRHIVERLWFVRGSVAISNRSPGTILGWPLVASIAAGVLLATSVALDDWMRALIVLPSAGIGIAVVLNMRRGKGLFMAIVRRLRLRNVPVAWRIVAAVMALWVVWLVLIVGLTSIALLVLRPHSGGSGAGPFLRPPFRTYTVLVRQAGSRPDVFSLDIFVSTEEGRIVQLGRRLAGSSSASGFLARRVAIPGPDRYSAPADPTWDRQAGMPSGTDQPVNLCELLCPDVNVRFENFPLDSVWQVQSGEIVDHRVSGDREVAVASIAGADIGNDDVQFTYFPAPYNSWRPYLGPIPGASSLPALAVALIGTILSGIWLLALGGLEAAILRFVLPRRNRDEPAGDRARRTAGAWSGSDKSRPQTAGSRRRGRPRRPRH